MIERVTDEQTWNEQVLAFNGHPLQLWGWGKVKASHNWKVERILIKDGASVVGGAQVLVRPLPKPFNSLAYVPRGPFGNTEGVLRELVLEIKKAWRPTHLSIEPGAIEINPGKGWKKSKNPILLARTLQLDLSKTTDELLADMAKKTRQYIRKSTNDGIVIRQLKTKDEIAECLTIYKQTATRAGFALHDDQYYYDVHEYLGEASVIFGAYSQNTLVSFVWLAISGEVAFELYGGMNDLGQELRANYALKWYAITKCKEWDIATYDMNGLLNDGVSNFKQGFASHETMLAGTYDYPLSPLYSTWTTLLPSAKKIIRKIKSKR
jgi:lipid II:glycine glycyltransferase (peptidoglycan interpeptide bridge formation enzyme)